MGAKHDIFFKIAVPAGYSIKMGPDGKKYVAYEPTDAGTVDHAALETNLEWTTSAHTGTSMSAAVFDALGRADEITLTTGESLRVDETGLMWEAYTPSGTVAAGTDNIGYLNIPVNSQSADYTTVLTDSGKCIFHPDYSSFADVYATLNPSNKSATLTLSNGNLTSTDTGDGWSNILGTLGRTTGKWYWESTCGASAGSHRYGVTYSSAYNQFTYLGDSTSGFAYLANGDIFAASNVVNSTGVTYSTGDIIGVALNLDNFTVDFYKNNVLVYHLTGLDTDIMDPILFPQTFYPAFTTNNTNDSLTVNFGAVEFAYTPPTGFLGLTTEVETEHAPNTYTIASNASVAYPNGSVIAFINDTLAGDVTIAIDSDTLVLAGAGTTGSRTLAANGMATAIKIGTTRWLISGTNLT